jgi:hypothetical protein
MLLECPYCIVEVPKHVRLPNRRNRLKVTKELEKVRFSTIQGYVEHRKVCPYQPKVTATDSMNVTESVNIKKG